MTILPWWDRLSGDGFAAFKQAVRDAKYVDAVMMAERPKVSADDLAVLIDAGFVRDGLWTLRAVNEAARMNS